MKKIFISDIHFGSPSIKTLDKLIKKAKSGKLPYIIELVGEPLPTLKKARK